MSPGDAPPIRAAAAYVLSLICQSDRCVSITKVCGCSAALTKADRSRHCLSPLRPPCGTRTARSRSLRAVQAIERSAISSHGRPSASSAQSSACNASWTRRRPTPRCDRPGDHSADAGRSRSLSSTRSERRSRALLRPGHDSSSNPSRRSRSIKARSSCARPPARHCCSSRYGRLSTPPRSLRPSTRSTAHRPASATPMLSTLALSAPTCVGSREVTLTDDAARCATSAVYIARVASLHRRGQPQRVKCSLFVSEQISAAQCDARPRGQDSTPMELIRIQPRVAVGQRSGEGVAADQKRKNDRGGNAHPAGDLGDGPWPPSQHRPGH